MNSLTRRNFFIHFPLFYPLPGGRELLNYYCEQIPGDAMLFSMFKIDSEPVKCPPPLKGMHDSVFFNLFVPVATSARVGTSTQWRINQFPINNKMLIAASH